jgi:hypothetical protein
MGNTENKKTNVASLRQASNLPRGIKWLISFCIFLCLAIIVFLGVKRTISKKEEGYRESAKQYCQKELEYQIAEIKSGRMCYVTFYCSTGTDSLLKQLIELQQIEGIVLNLSDATDEGMASIAALKNLKYLRLYGSKVSDAGFLCLKNASNLEHLELVNTEITDKSLALLENMPNLNFLALSHESRLGTTFTETSLENIKALIKLKKLYLCGGWASDSAIKKLQESLPDCTISIQDGDLAM